jgi:hypothetical protein
MALVHLHLSFAKLEFIVIIVAWILYLCISARHLVATTPLLDGGSQHPRMAAMNLSIAYFSLSK